MDTPRDPHVIAEWFIYHAEREGEFLTQMKLQKLVYMAHGWSLGLLGKPLIDEQVQAWKWGPVIKSLYRDYARFGSQPIIDVPRCPPKMRDDEEAILKAVWESYGRHTAAQLSDLTHRPGTPWAKTYRPGVTNVIIDRGLIAEHYKALCRDGE